MVPSEDELTQETIQHWKNFLPGLAANLEANGVLEEQARKAARETLDHVAQRVKEGLHPMEAYQLMRNDWCFLDPKDWGEPEPE